MFAGIGEGRGTIRAVARRGDGLEVRIDAGGLLPGPVPGGSIAVNGCCLTAVRADPSGFSCELTEETLKRTAFRDRLQPGVRVNLERPLRADGRFDGHIVQAHVDGGGPLLELRLLGQASGLT